MARPSLRVFHVSREEQVEACENKQRQQRQFDENQQKYGKVGMERSGIYLGIRSSFEKIDEKLSEVILANFSLKMFNEI